MKRLVSTLHTWHHFAFGVVLGGLLNSSCTPGRNATHPYPPEKAAAQAAFGEASAGQITIREYPDRPRTTIVTRQGDPAGAVAAVVLTDGTSQQSVVLAEVVRTRLQRQGITNVDVIADRLGYRVRALAATPSEVKRFLRALRNALDHPVAAQSEEASAAAKGIKALALRPLDGPELGPIAACTGALGEPASTRMIDLTKAEGVGQLEKWRKAIHGSQRIALAVVGPATLGEAVQQELDSGKPWPSVQPPSDPWPDQDHVVVYALPGSNSSPSLTVAARIAPTFAVSLLAEQVFDANGSLANRLASATSWRLRKTTATVRPRGACLAVTLERKLHRKNAVLAGDAAHVAAILMNEIRSEASAAAMNRASVAGSRVLQAADPRDAASLAAWWSHAAKLKAGQARFATALGIPVGKLTPKAGDNTLAEKLKRTRATLQSALPQFTKTWTHPVVERRVALEKGQGELWLLIASPCGTSAETKSDAGYTALASVAAASATDGLEGVGLEPWIAQDGVGILAHGARRENESATDLAKRVANAASVALLGAPPPAHVISQARSRLLQAVIANEDEKQSSLAVETVDRWVVHRSGSKRKCPPISSASSATPSTTNDVVLYSSERSPHALIGLAIENPTDTDALMLALLREALAGDDGILRHAYGSFSGPVRFSVHTMGQRNSRAIVLEVHCAAELLESAIQQARAVLQRLQQGAATEAHFQRALSKVEASRLSAQLDPRTRLADIWRGKTNAAASTTRKELNAWLARSLRDASLRIVRVNPPKTDEEKSTTQ
ncbi:MAG: hypothetical protein CSA75_00220 [Sorangium cellulosum]|nr:MAG: hypothetical protein CSA75_00220 [Sorangium cellulosum]